MNSVRYLPCSNNEYIVTASNDKEAGTFLQPAMNCHKSQCLLSCMAADLAWHSSRRRMQDTLNHAAVLYEDTMRSNIHVSEMAIYMPNPTLICRCAWSIW